MTDAVREQSPLPVVAPPAERPSPGRLLRTARERAGLGPEDLAGQLKLAKGTLEALERDDFAALSEPVYVRGYYRKIAKLLPVSETELIEAYTAHTSGGPGKAPQPGAAMRRIPLAGGVAAGTSRQYRGQGVWVIVAAVVLAGFLFAVVEHESPERLKVDEPKPEEPAPAASPMPQAPPVAAAPNITTAAPSVTPAPKPGASPAQVQAPAPSAPAAAAAKAPPATPAAATAATTGAAVAATPVVPPTQLALEFSEASFVRVEDSRGKTLAIGLVRGGEHQALTGEPPYIVFLGNAQNVKVFYGGRPVDFSPHVNRQNDTARFTVP